MLDDDFKDLGKHKDRSTLKKAVLACAAIVLIAAVLLEINNSRSDKTDQPKPEGQSNTSNKKALGESSGASTPKSPTPPPTPPSPLTLPETFSDKKDVIRDGSTESYAVSDSHGNIYYIIQQPLLPTLEVGAFESKLTNSEKLTVPTGAATIGENNTQLIASIRTPGDKTWILITTPDVSLRAGLKDLVNAVKPG